MKKFNQILFLFALLLILPISAQAFEVRSNESININADKIINGSLYAIGDNISIDGIINGDIICGGQTININGQINGDVICGGQTININGPVTGNVRVIGNTININSQIDRNISVFGVSINLGSNSHIKGEALVAGENLKAQGKIDGDLHGGVSQAIITGVIKKNIQLKLEHDELLTISKDARVNGNINYTASKAAIISEEAEINGEISHSLPSKKYKENFLAAHAWSGLYSIFASLAIGLVLISLWPKKTIQLTSRMLKKANISIGLGIAIMFLTPVIAIILLFTVIGIPLAGILLGIWIIAIALSKTLFAIMLGNKITTDILKKENLSLIWIMVIGVAVSWLIFNLPIIGWIIALVATWWSLGGLFLHFKKY